MHISRPSRVTGTMILFSIKSSGHGNLSQWLKLHSISLSWTIMLRDIIIDPLYKLLNKNTIISHRWLVLYSKPSYCQFSEKVTLLWFIKLLKCFQLMIFLQLKCYISVIQNYLKSWKRQGDVFTRFCIPVCDWALWGNKQKAWE